MTNQERGSQLERIEVLDGFSMAFREFGRGDHTILLLHGNPSSSYLWRNIAPALSHYGRCIAPDLIGMGASDKLPNSGPKAYDFDTHRRFLDAFCERIGLGDKVVLVLHDWGSALGFDWARRHPNRVKGLAYMEAIVAPMTWDDWPENARGIFQAMRTPAGESIVLEKNVFVERILPASIIRELDAEEMDAYRAPFAAPGEARRPTLTWPRQIPIDGQPTEVHEVVATYADWLAQCSIPKLFINAEPGILLRGRLRELCRRWPNQQEITVQGLHFIQEDAPIPIRKAIAAWLADLSQS